MKLILDKYVDGDEALNVEIEQGMILPSQTRNPAFGIFPQLDDEEVVVRHPVFNFRTVNRMRESDNQEVRKLYDIFRKHFIYSGTLQKLLGRGFDSPLKTLDMDIKRGNFPSIDFLLKISPKTLQKYLPASTYQAIRSYQESNIDLNISRTV